MTEELNQPRDRRVSDLFEQIARLKVGEAVVSGGESDVRYLSEKIARLRAEDPSLGDELDGLVVELDTVDPSLSTYEARRTRSSRVEGGEIAWNAVNRDALQLLGILDGESRTPAKITKEAAQAVVNERGLEDGIYTLRNAAGEVYIIVRDGNVDSQVFEPPTYDVGYLMRGSYDLTFKRVIQL